MPKAFYFILWLLYLLLITIFNRFFSFSFYPLWLGAAIGFFLPLVDHLFYVFFINPTELTSQRVRFLFSNKEFLKAFFLLSRTKQERKNLILHKDYSQIIFALLSFLFLTSSTSLFAKGIVVFFYFRLFIEQIFQYLSGYDLEYWFEAVPVKERRWMKNFFVFFFGFLLLLFIPLF